MKVGILTFHNERNYGAFLQTYALYKYVSSQGYKVEIIDFNLDETFRHSWRVKLFRPIIDRRIWQKALNKYVVLSTDNYTYSTRGTLSNLDYDVYLLGSDQVWNPDITGKACNIYAFDFLEKTDLRISYASSFGLNRWPFEFKDTESFRVLLNEFQHLSVREPTAQVLLQDHCSLSAEVVVDPTLLLSDYSEITTKYVRTVARRMVCFKFTKGDGFYQFVRDLKRIHNLDVLVLNKTIPPLGIKVISLPTIQNWLKALSSAEYIFTDSYHGLIFSLIFKKKVIVKPANVKNFGRLKDLLKSLNLENRIYYEYDSILSSDKWKQEIDYARVWSTLTPLISSSKSYLNNALKECEKIIDKRIS